MVTHVCCVSWLIIGLGIGLLPDRRQVMTWISADLLKKVEWNLNLKLKKSFNKMLLNMLSTKVIQSQPQCVVYHKMSSCHGNDFRIIGRLWPTSGFPSQRANDTVLDVPIYWHEWTVEQKIKMSVIWDAMASLCRHCNDLLILSR